MSGKPFTILIEIISALLILLFVYTALSKLIDFHKFRIVLTISPLIGTNAKFIGGLIIIIELATAFLLLIPSLRKLGLCMSFLMMTAFTLYIGYMITSSSTLPCSCGGVIQQMTWKQHFLFNVIFTSISLIGVLFYGRGQKHKYLSEHKPIAYT